MGKAYSFEITANLPGLQTEGRYHSLNVPIYIFNMPNLLTSSFTTNYIKDKFVFKMDMNRMNLHFVAYYKKKKHQNLILKSCNFVCINQQHKRY